MININGEEWQLYLASPQHSELQRDDGSFALGCCNNSTKSIYIRENLDSELLKKVLCHELTHASMFSYGVKLSYEQEELLADLLATYGQEIIDITNKIFARLKNKGLTK